MGEAYSFGNIHLEFVDVGCGSQTHSTIVLQFLNSLSEDLLICKGDCKMKPMMGKTRNIQRMSVKIGRAHV